MTPSSVLPTMASSEDSTMAASQASVAVFKRRGGVGCELKKILHYHTRARKAAEPKKPGTCAFQSSQSSRGRWHRGVPFVAQLDARHPHHELFQVGGVEMSA